MRTQLSSSLSFLAKVVIPAGWSTFMGLGLLFLSPARWIYLAVLLLGGVFVSYWIRLKVVSVDGDRLYVSNYLEEISIPLADISDVTENNMFWMPIRPVTIHLRTCSKFGVKILFLPKLGFGVFGYHVVVNDLKELARQEGARLKPGKGTIGYSCYDK